MAELARGVVVAGCRIEAVVGRGGMGVVYRATQLSLDRQVALKAIAPELASDATFRERFKRESQIAASIEHPNVIPVYEAGEGEGLLYLTMRYVEGTDLRALIAAEGGLDPHRSARIVGQMAAALAAAHRRGLVHRDVKPANVLIAAGEDREHAYLTDFGIARHVAATSGLTRTGAVVGTIDYLAPERIQDGSGDASADVYGLGCVLFEALTGSVPYPRDNDVAKMYAHLNAPTPLARELDASIPVRLSDLAQQAMAKDPADRFETAGELASALFDASASLPPAGPAGGAARAPEPAAPRAKEAALAPEPAAPAPERAAPAPEPATPAPEPAAATTDATAPGPAAPGTAAASAAAAADPETADTASAVPATTDALPVESVPVEAAAERAVAEPALPRSRRRRRPVLLWLAAAVAAAGVALAVALRAGGGDGDGGERSSGLDPRPLPSGAVELANGVDGVAVGLGHVWVANKRTDQVIRVTPGSGRRPRAIRVGRNPDSVAVDADRELVWVTNTDDDTITGIEPDGSVAIRSLQVGDAPEGIAVGHGAIWVANGGDGSVTRIDQEDLEPTRIEVGRGPVQIGIAPDETWVTLSDGRRVVALDPETGDRLRSVRVGGDKPARTRGIAFGAGRLWVSAPERNYVYRFDPAEPSPKPRRIWVDQDPRELRYGLGGVWISHGRGGGVSAIDPDLLEPTSLVAVGKPTYGLGLGNRVVWAAGDGKQNARLVPIQPRRE